MIRHCSIRTNLRVAALAGLLVVASATAPAQQPGGNPFDGEWSLVLDVSTAPGGATLIRGDTTISPYNFEIHGANERFQVKEDGSFEWSQSDAGSTLCNGVIDNSTGTTRFWASQKLELRAAGKIEVTRPAAGEPRDEDRGLTVETTFIHGNGYYSVTGPTVTATIALSNPANGPAGVEPWNLKPKRVTKEELAPDVIRQTITYEATRQTRNPSEAPLTERIQVKHVRYLGLVPRG